MLTDTFKFLRRYGRWGVYAYVGQALVGVAWGTYIGLSQAL